MPAIEVTNLQKTFQSKRKAAGMSGPSHLTDAGSVVDITISDPPLGKVIAKIFQTQY
jgi:hypothetical protein